VKSSPVKDTKMAKKNGPTSPPQTNAGGLIMIDVHGAGACIRSSFTPPLKSKIEVKNWVYPVGELTVIGHKWVLDDNSSELMLHVLTSPARRPSPSRAKAKGQ
jgi:hypothetical protein